MKAYFGYSPETMGAVGKIFAGSKILSQGNPAVTVHPMTREKCLEIRKGAHLPYVKDSEVCHARNMSPIYDPDAGQTAKDAHVCIDQYEFPNIPCEYPVVRVTAREAALLCEAVGKRLCDAHEWEGACAGQLRPPEDEYAWGQERKVMKSIHNHNRKIVWAYGKNKDFSLCAMGSHKSEGCNGGSWKHCGSNTYPCGAFPKCVSRFGVFDQHGNAAEHMSLPMSRDELARPGHYGVTEMKGSWFIFQSYEAHDDDCRWRAPDWHASKVMDPGSHSNYHLGFRCCKDVKRPKNK
jgi:formylglycine-generating enzyme required for sulfatase activity